MSRLCYSFLVKAFHSFDHCCSFYGKGWSTTDPQHKASPFFSLFSDPQRTSLPEGGLGADIRQVCKSVLADVYPLGLSADLDDLRNMKS